ncbi:unnamed protein product, partial [Ectocarpus sp. 12 AP-2014]
RRTSVGAPIARGESPPDTRTRSAQREGDTAHQRERDSIKAGDTNNFLFVFPLSVSTGCACSLRVLLLLFEDPSSFTHRWNGAGWVFASPKASSSRSSSQRLSLPWLRSASLAVTAI